MGEPDRKGRREKGREPRGNLKEGCSRQRKNLGMIKEQQRVNVAGVSRRERKGGDLVVVVVVVEGIGKAPECLVGHFKDLGFYFNNKYLTNPLAWYMLFILSLSFSPVLPLSLLVRQAFGN